MYVCMYVCAPECVRAYVCVACASTCVRACDRYDWADVCLVNGDESKQDPCSVYA